jgi:hypothetical protein
MRGGEGEYCAQDDGDPACQTSVGFVSARHADAMLPLGAGCAPTRLAEGEPADTHGDVCRASRFRERKEVAYGSHLPAEAARNGIAWRHGSRTGQHRGVTGRARERPGGHVPRALGLAPRVASGQSLGRLRPDGLCSLDIAMQGHDASLGGVVARRSAGQGSPKVLAASHADGPRPDRRPPSAPPAPGAGTGALRPCQPDAVGLSRTRSPASSQDGNRAASRLDIRSACGAQHGRRPRLRRSSRARRRRGGAARSHRRGSRPIGHSTDARERRRQGRRSEHRRRRR